MFHPIAKITVLLMIITSLYSCSKRTLSLRVCSERDFDTDYEIVEVDAASIVSRMHGAPFVITDGQAQEVPYQLTYDGKLIFPASVGAHAVSEYAVRRGIAASPTVLATGRVYPERLDDMAWENDKIGFRAYGPESQRRLYRLYGYDLFLKRDTSFPMIEQWVALNQSASIQARIDSLKAVGEHQEAKRLDDAKSYHIDHGHGMDCYAVGPTLGAATSAIVYGGDIVYPWCYESCQVLDDGPLRFTAALDFKPQSIGPDQVAEHRIITLDAGSHLNHTTVTYHGLTTAQPIITGIVVHDGSEVAACSPEQRYIAYLDPTQGSDNGEIYIGAIFTHEPDTAAITAHAGVRHVAAISKLPVGGSYSYYWGAAWDRADIPTWDSWLSYLDSYVLRTRSPLRVVVK